MTPDDFFSPVNARRGHFLYESGYHSDLWIDLETLCHHPATLRLFVTELCKQIVDFAPEVICGPLVEGAFVALLAASELQRDFVYTLRHTEPDQDRLFPVSYDLPKSLQSTVAGRRVAIVNDVISAGSAVRGTLNSLTASGADVVCIASLVVLGESFTEFARELAMECRTLLTLPNNIWKPEECPLCLARTPLQKLSDH